jgi:hypothetical protein
MKRIAAFAAGMLCGLGVAGPAEPIPCEPPEGVEYGGGAQEPAHWPIGFPTNVLKVYPPPEEPRPHALCPVQIDHFFRPRRTDSIEQWEQHRADIRRRVTGYFGRTPDRAIPLAPKVEAETEWQTLQVNPWEGEE